MAPGGGSKWRPLDMHKDAKMALGLLEASNRLILS